jgi:O-antigen ligase
MTRNVISGLLVSIPSLLALFVYTRFAGAFDPSKTLLLRGLVLLIIGGLLFLLAKHKELKFVKERFSTTGAKLVFAMLFVIFLATVLSPQRLNSVWGTYERGLGLVQWLSLGSFFGLLLLFLNEKWLKRGLFLLLSSGSVVSLYGLLQALGWDPIFSNYNTDYLEGRIFSTMGNPDFLAQFLAPLILIATLWFWKSRNLLLLVPLGLMVPALVLTESRASFLALIISLGLFAVLLVKQKKKLILPFMVLIGMFFLGTSLEVPLFDRFQITPENYRSMESRLLIWDVAVQAIVEQPILGLGPDNFGVRFHEYMEPRFYYVEDHLHISADRAHNELLEMGLIGGLPLMALYLALGLWVLKFLRKNPKEHVLEITLALSITLMFLQNQLSFPQMTHYAMFFFFLAGLVIKVSGSTVTVWKPTRLFYRFGIPLCALFLLCTTYVTWVKPVYAEAWYTYALMTDDKKNGLENAIIFSPWTTRFRYDLLMWFPETRGEQLSALEIIEGSSINVLAWTANYTLNFDPELSFELFETVIALNPQYPHTQRAYADALYLKERYEESAVQYEIFLDLVPDFWSWCPELETYSEYEQKKYRIFYKNVPDFNNSLIHLQHAYAELGQAEKVEELERYLSCGEL